MEWLARAEAVLLATRTPLALAGLSVLVLCVIYKQVLDLGIFSQLDSGGTLGLLGAMVGYAFWLALVSVVLGVIGYLINAIRNRAPDE